jgi:N-acetylglucosaminyl-diphospho-decaprenol L-rhamnosyltransferase
MAPELTVIVVSFNTRDLLEACLASVYRQTKGVSFEIVVVDNASADGSVAMVRQKFPEVVLVECRENCGFGRANNLGFDRSRAASVMLLNSDAELLEDTGTELVRFLARRPSAGVVGPDVVLHDGTLQPKTCGMLPTARVMANQNLLLCRLFPRSRFFAGLYVESGGGGEARMGWVSGVCMVVRREAYEQTKGFDPRIFMYAEDIDLCARAAALGWETWRIRSHAVKHLLGGSSRTTDGMMKLRVMQQRNMLLLADRSMGAFGRFITRATLATGLILRVPLRGVASFRPGGELRRQAFRADLSCLSDFFIWNHGRGEDGHAHRN